MKLQYLLAVFVLPFSTTQAWSAEGDLPYRTSGFYAGAGLGYGDVSVEQDPVTVSGGALSWKFLGGYRFPQGYLPWGIHVGLEAAWLSLGEVDEQTGQGKLALETSGIEGYFVGMIPLSRRFELIGKLGAIAWDADLEFDGAKAASESGTDLALALGIAYHTGDQVSVQLEVESLNLLDGAYVASVAIAYQFK